MPAGRVALFASFLVLFAAAQAQTVAVVTSGDEIAAFRSSAISNKLADPSLRVLDSDLVRAAFASAKPGSPFNMSIADAKRLGSVIGCNFIVLIKTDVLRRTSLERNQYWEAYAAIYTISSRTGNLLYWTLKTNDADAPETARAKLSDRIDEIAGQLQNELAVAKMLESGSNSRPSLKTPDDFAGQKLFRAPVPFNRIKPEYTRTAYLYGAEGTVDVEADIDERGNVMSTNITRWLGFGLDQSVERAVREMNWRPAEIDGKPLAMRVLLRYNFKKIDKE
jgi:TonB family protein